MASSPACRWRAVGVSEFQLPLRVYIEDTDAGGIVYYVNYLKYMERARTEFMRRVGCARAALFEADSMFVVQSVDIEYRRPARLDDELVATAKICETGAAQIIFEQRILRAAEHLCGGLVRVVCVDRHSMKPRRMPRSLLAALAGARPTSPD